jgi:hypothetical protein
MSLEAMERDAKMIFQCSDAQPDDRRKLLSIAADKIPKCTIDNIPKRLTLVKQIRAAGLNCSEYPAEDIEFLIAVAFHGMDTTSISLAMGHTLRRSYTSGSKHYLSSVTTPG